MPVTDKGSGARGIAQFPRAHQESGLGDGPSHPLFRCDHSSQSIVQGNLTSLGASSGVCWEIRFPQSGSLWGFYVNVQLKRPLALTAGVAVTENPGSGHSGGCAGAQGRTHAPTPGARREVCCHFAGVPDRNFVPFGL